MMVSRCRTVSVSYNVRILAGRLGFKNSTNEACEILNIRRNFVREATLQRHVPKTVAQLNNPTYPYSLCRYSGMGPVSRGLFLIRGTSLMAQHAEALRVRWRFPSTVSQLRCLSRLQRNAQKKSRYEAKLSRKARCEASIRARREAFSRLAWRQERSDSLRTALMRQYEEETRPRWSCNSERLGPSLNVHTETSSGGSPQAAMNNQSSQNPQESKEVQCGIFWDIENVRNEYIPLLPRSDIQGHTLRQSSLKRFVTLLAVQLLQYFKRTCPASR
jgi:hypothetical protein